MEMNDNSEVIKGQLAALSLCVGTGEGLHEYGLPQTSSVLSACQFWFKTSAFVSSNIHLTFPLSPALFPWQPFKSPGKKGTAASLKKKKLSKGEAERKIGKVSFQEALLLPLFLVQVVVVFFLPCCKLWANSKCFRAHKISP